MKILLIDDHPLFRAGFELLLKELEPRAEIFHAGTCAEGIEMARRKALNLAFLDLGLPDGDGLACLRALKEARPSLPVVVVSGILDRASVEQALELKAMGFVPKWEKPDMLAAALRAALAGGVFLPAGLLAGAANGAAVRGPHRAESAALKPCMAGELGITQRQLEVLRLLVQGLPNKRIAGKLNISVQVVKKHVSDLLAHFHALNRTQLVAQIAARGIFLGPPELSDPRDELPNP